MTYFEAVSIEQDLIVAMQYADALHKTPAEALKEAAGKYSNEQFAEAYRVIKAKKKEELATLKSLLVLAVRSKTLNTGEAKNDH